MTDSSWRLFVDTGGTFTDALAATPEGNWRRAKVLSSGALRGTIRRCLGPRDFIVEVSWRATVDVLRGGAFRCLGGDDAEVAVAAFDPATAHLTLSEEPTTELSPGAAFEVVSGEEAPVLAARLLTGTAAGVALPRLEMRLGTTRATNALLTRSGDPVVLFVTRGFADLLAIGNQQRPDLFALAVHKTPPLPTRVVEVDERVAADGSVLQQPDLDRLRAEAAALQAEGFRSAAVALMHADRYPQHEEDVASCLREIGFNHVASSAALAPVIRIVPRAETAVVDATLAALIVDYLDCIGEALAGGRLLVMTSAGGLVARDAVRPKDMLLSGPAGGVVGAARAGRLAGHERLISFDMGGTSSDVARYDGRLDYCFEHGVGDAQLLAPALAIETVAAGGGSICRYESGELAVGPRSAGAVPGPACYGAGGPLTLTDVNLLLGRLEPERFGIPVVVEAARRELAVVQSALRARSDTAPAAEELLEGFLAIADERMADAIARISLRCGYDPAEYKLVAFGGAGGQHACAVAERLGVTGVVVPPDAGLLSAWGMAGAAIEGFAECQILAPLVECAAQLPLLLDELAADALGQLAMEGVGGDAAVLGRRIVELRLLGQDTTLQLDLEPGAATDEVALEEAFGRHYADIYGHRPEQRPIEVVSLRVVASSREDLVAPAKAAVPIRDFVPTRTRRACFDGKWQQTPCCDRDELAPGASCRGPLIVLEEHSATVVRPGWRLVVAASGALDLRRDARQVSVPASAASPARPEAVQIELFASRFTAIARQMGEVLRRTAVSTNIKERLDFSCALLAPDAELVVNAPHIPVHLGALGMCVQSVCSTIELKPGDMAVTNHPAFGGSHLPDLTVIAPVYEGNDEQEALLGYVAARAHHAEIGGIRPGSMPPMATSLIEEGVVIRPTLVVAGGRACWEELRDLLRSAPWPTRAFADNLADLRAAVAACHRGAGALRGLGKDHSAASVAHYMSALTARADGRMRAALSALPDGVYKAVEELDDGSPLVVTVTIDGDRVCFDFAGTAAVHAGNMNATPAIVHAVVIYVLRLLVQEDLPLNGGLLRPVEIRLPAGLLDPPFGSDPARDPAIVGGNVETSQRLVDTLLKALGLSACSQGTMNNLLFGDAQRSYYETVCGGCGAGPDWDGASAVHSHMTNTRITDPEVLEQRFPVRLERFAIRRGSGGAGRRRGGDGVLRELVFLAPLELSLLSQHRRSGPYGLEGGLAGAVGRQRLVKTNGSTVELAGCVSISVEGGERLILETPGGGGYGSPGEAGP